MNLIVGNKYSKDFYNEDGNSNFVIFVSNKLLMVKGLRYIIGVE